MRLATAFILSLLFLLATGNDHRSVHANHHCPGYVPAKLPQQSRQTPVGHVQNSPVQIRTANTSSPAITPIDVTDEIEDDDDYTSSRKFVEFTNHFLTLFYNLLPGNLSRYQQGRLPFCEHFSYTSSDKYIIHRVIRV